MSTVTTKKPDVVYPESDGKPMAENTEQFKWIVTIEGGLDALFRDNPDVFVAGDLLWYPIEGDPNTCTAPDAMVVFGRPKGFRGSYQQWVEGNIPPQVVFEVLSPSNRHADHIRKFNFYQDHGVEEYYVYDPDRGTLEGWQRKGQRLREIPQMHGWVSPRLGIRFELQDDELRLFQPNGEQFASYVELAAQRDREKSLREQAERDREQAERQRDEAQRQNEHLRARLRELGIDPDQNNLGGQAGQNSPH
jgi:Uma2 family endonuclease